MRPELVVEATSVLDMAVLTPQGVLNGATYQNLRDRIIKAALDAPTAVIVDVTALSVPAESAWSVFTSARWHVARWPDVPIVLVCRHTGGRESIRRNGIARYVPVFPSISEALDTLGDDEPPRYRQRVRTDLPADSASLGQSRQFVEDWLTTWAQRPLIATAKVVVTAFVENVLAHTESQPKLRLETDGTVVTVAVEDASRTPPSMREDVEVAAAPSGLKIVAALCRAWGNAPTPNGKTVWAVMGPENRL